MPTYVSLKDQGFYEPFNQAGNNLRYLATTLINSKQQQQENEFKRRQLALAESQQADTHALNAQKIQEGGYSLQDLQRARHLRDFDPDAAIGDESPEDTTSLPSKPVAPVNPTPAITPPSAGISRSESSPTQAAPAPTTPPANRDSAQTYSPRLALH